MFLDKNFCISTPVAHVTYINISFTVFRSGSSVLSVFGGYCPV